MHDLTTASPQGLAQHASVQAKKPLKAYCAQRGVSEQYPPALSIECPCGCGETFSPIGSRGRPRSYFSPACSLRVNHNALPSFAGRTHTAETKAILSEKASRPKPWIRGDRNGMAGRVGPSNPNWQGGTSPERQRLYAGATWRNLRRIVIARDRACTRCGSTTTRHLHHVKPWATYPDLRFDTENIVLLCRDCHHDAHRKEVCHQ